MSEIRNLTRNGETFYPLTHVDGVIGRNGVPLGEVNGIFDVSEYNATGDPLINAQYDTLPLALAAVPQERQKGGMTIRYIDSVSGEYVQYRYMSTSTLNTDFINTSNWQGVDDEPTAGSVNLVQSGGVYTVVNNIKSTVVGDIYLQSARDFDVLNSCIAELYINPFYLVDGTIVDFHAYVSYANTGKLICKCDCGWHVNNDIYYYSNGDVISIRVTTAGGNASVGDIIGYVIFKDISTFLSNSYGDTISSYHNPLNLLFVNRIQNSPSIASYLQIQTYEKKQIYAKSSSTVSVVPTYEACIEDLYIEQNALILSSVNYVSLSNYNGTLYLYGKTSSGATSTFTCANSMTNYSNGDVIPLIVTTAGDGLSKNDIIGYVIFKDISTFRATNYGGSSVYINLSLVCNIVNSPKLISYFVIPKTETKPIYTPNSSIAVIETYEACVSEIWVNSKFGSSAYSFKNYSGFLYLNYGRTNKFECKKSLSNYSNGDIIPLIVTSSSNANVLIGDVVGYVIFKDIDTFKVTNYGGQLALLNLDRAFNLEDNTTIWYGTIVTPENVEQIVNEKIAPNISIALPQIIYAAVGVELNIYNDTVALSMDKGLNSPANYIVRWDCGKGTITDRAFRFTPTSGDVGDVSLTCYIYDTTGKLIKTKSLTIKVVAAQLSEVKRVVFFGDSTGAGSASALYNDFNSELFTGTKPTMLGIRGTTPKYEAFGGARWDDYATEGRGAFRCQVSGVGPIALNSTYTNNGFTWTVVEVNVNEGEGNILITKDSLYSNPDAPQTNGTLVSTSGGTNIPYTNATKEGANPLWYNNSIDFAHYRDVLGLSSSEKLDIVSFQLGLNGTASVDTVRQQIIDLYEAAIADNPNCIFIIGLITGPANELSSFGQNYGAGNWMSSINKYQERRKMYIELAESGDYPNMRLATPNLNIDRYYGYPMSSRNVSARNSTQEQYHTNFVHPNSTGYAQIGDSFFSAYIAALT